MASSEGYTMSWHTQNALYAWTFGDGQIGTGITTSQTDTATGTDTATVTATNGVGSANATTIVTIEPLKIYLQLNCRHQRPTSRERFRVTLLARSQSSSRDRRHRADNRTWHTRVHP